MAFFDRWRRWTNGSVLEGRENYDWMAQNRNVQTIYVCLIEYSRQDCGLWALVFAELASEEDERAAVARVVSKRVARAIYSCATFAYTSAHANTSLFGGFPFRNVAIKRDSTPRNTNCHRHRVSYRLPSSTSTSRHNQANCNIIWKA